MSHELFRDVTDTRPRAGRAAGGTLAVSIAAHALILAAVIVVPLLATDALPKLSDSLDSFIPVAPPPPPAAAPTTDRTQTKRSDTPRESTPLAPPDEIRAEDPRPSAGEFAIDDGSPTPPTDVGGVIGSTGSGVAQPTPPPPPPVPISATRIIAHYSIHPG